MTDLVEEIGQLLRAKGLTLGTVESATGGLLAYRVTAIPGSSDYFSGSIVSYSNEIKMKLAGVRSETLKKYGAVSRQVAAEMAAGGRAALEVDICLADTGIAGPGGATPGKGVGLFYIGLAHKDGAEARRHVFHGDRGQNRELAAEAALKWLKQYLLLTAQVSIISGQGSIRRQ